MKYAEYDADKKKVSNCSIRNMRYSCNCGCKGTDSWHQRRIVRAVRDVTPLTAVKVRTTFDLGDNVVIATHSGTAKFPWGKEVVYRVVDHPDYPGISIENEWTRVEEIVSSDTPTTHEENEQWKKEYQEQKAQWDAEEEGK